MINDAASILVIILSIVLFVFLVISIILTFYLFSVIKKIKALADQVENTAKNIQSTTENIAKVSSPAFIIKAVKNIFKRKKGNKEDE